MKRSTRTLLVLTAISALAACGDDAGGDSPDVVAPDAVSDAADAGEVGADAAAEVGDATASYFEDDDAYVLERSHANVLRQITFAGEIEPGVAEGFDLDGRVSEDGDERSCGHGDRVSPDGDTGIDNQLAELWGVIEPLVGEQAEELLQGAINEGRVLIVAELVGVDDLQNDDDVTFNLYRVLADPDIGTFGLIAPSQTYYLDYDKPISTVEHVAIVDGELVGGPVRLDIPISILQLDVVFPVEDAYVRMQLDEGGASTGILAGALDVEMFIDAVLATPAAAEMRLVAPFFRDNADMEKVDGVCRKMSVTFGFEATTAFVVRDASMESNTGE